MRRLYSTGTTKRYHVVPGMQQDVAAHSWGVAVIIAHLYPSASKQLLLAALYHDCAEKFVGDVPATTKWRNATLKEEIEKEEAHWDRELNIAIRLTPEEKTWLRAADLLELVLFCEHSLAMGNQYALDTYQNGLAALKGMFDLPAPVGIFIKENF